MSQSEPILVITSCTSKKLWKPDNALCQADFRDPARLKYREAQLTSMTCAAGRMYTGGQHLALMEGIRTLRQAGISVDLQIVSAGYGLIPERRPIVPYNVTFNDMPHSAVVPWARFLGTPGAVRDVVKPYPLAFFLLGDRYLTAIEPPLYPRPEQRFVFFAAPTKSGLAGPGVTTVPAGKELCSLYHAGLVALKGSMFRTLACALAAAPSRWIPAIQADSTGKVIQQALAAGLATGGNKHV